MGRRCHEVVNTDLGSPLAEPIRRFVAHKRALNRRFDTDLHFAFLSFFGWGQAILNIFFYMF